MTDKLSAAQEFLDRCDRELDEAIAHRQRAWAIFNDARERVRRFTIARNNALGEREMARAAASSAGEKRTAGDPFGGDAVTSAGEKNDG